jgi:hypothetical protein
MFFSFVSTAEKALQQSSGRSTPIRCWGCQGLHEDDNHTFRDCPRQNDPAVRQNFLSNLAEYRKRVATKNPNEYKRDGFTTKHQVTPFNTIADPDTSASQRRQALDELAEIQTGHKIHATRGTRKRRVAEDDGAYTFLFIQEPGLPCNEQDSSFTDSTVKFRDLQNMLPPLVQPSDPIFVPEKPPADSSVVGQELLSSHLTLGNEPVEVNKNHTILESLLPSPLLASPPSKTIRLSPVKFAMSSPWKISGLKLKTLWHSRSSKLCYRMEAPTRRSEGRSPLIGFGLNWETSC